MRWPAAQLTGPEGRARYHLVLFAGLELVLAMAIPFLLIRGYHALLDSRAGTVVAQPEADEPGWVVMVAPTPVVGVVELHDQQVTGLALIVGGALDSSGALEVAESGNTQGTILLAPASVAVDLDGRPQALTDLEPTSAATALADSLSIRLSSVLVMDSVAWASMLGDRSYVIDNPDPVPQDLSPAEGGDDTDIQSDPTLAFTVGPATVDGAGTAQFLGRPVDGGTLDTLMLRRVRFWEALVADPPPAAHPLARTLGGLVAPTSAVDVHVLPMLARSDPPSSQALDPVAAEALIREVVAFPSGARLKMRLVDRTGRADLPALAAVLAGRGIEIVEIANAVQFDQGATELIIPPEMTLGRGQMAELAGELGIEPVVDFELDADHATVLIGSDFELDPD